MKTHKYIIAAAPFMLLYLLVAWSVPSSAQTTSSPRTLSYQGVITTNGGTKAFGPHVLTVTLYGDANGTMKVWQSQMNTTLDSMGVFNCTLGTDANPLPEPSVMDRPLWLGVAVDGGAELRPLSQVTASAYALNVVDNAITTAKLADGAVTNAKLADNSVTTAKLADSSITASKVNVAAVNTANLADEAVTSSKIADSSVTSSKLNADYISSLSVNGQKVTGVGTNVNLVGTGGVELLYDATSNSLVLNGSTGTGKVDSNRIQSANGTGAGTVNTMNTCGSNNDGGQGENEVAGGCNNQITGGQTPVPFSFCLIGSGQNNLISSLLPGSPRANAVDEGTDWHTIAGGESNTIRIDVLGGGGGAEQGWLGASTIAGGDSNYLSSPYGFIGGGRRNTISDHIPTWDDDLGDRMIQDVIGGGDTNTITQAAESATIGGGSNNTIEGSVTWTTMPFTVTVNNTADYTTIGGGINNIITPANGNSPDFAAIGGGRKNTINDAGATIAGGDTNTASGFASSVLGGSNNTASGQDATVAGGSTNQATSDHTTIGGGWGNKATNSDATVAGGNSNTAKGFASTISGGPGNTVDNVNTTGEDATIAGGNGNKAGRMTFIGGGFSNDATGIIPSTPNIDQSATVGGSSLITDAQCQIVLGCSNLQAGLGHQVFAAGALSLHGNDCEFEIGSPVWTPTPPPNETWLPHNAFEVSYNGHSVVYHTNGSSMTPGPAGTPPVFQGATYVESPVYAWGAFTSTGKEIGTSDFGISEVQDLNVTAGAPAGTYLVTLSPLTRMAGRLRIYLSVPLRLP